jgi:hypothetical protein
MLISDVRAFAEVLSKITMSDSRIKGVSRPEAPGFVVEIIERELSSDSRRANAFAEIFEILKQNRFDIVAGVGCNEVLKYVSWAK